MKGGIYENKGKYGARWIVRYPGGIWRRFKVYEDAESFLIALNYRDQVEGGVDPRDYRKDVPLGFMTLADQWLDVKRSEGLRSLKNPINHIQHAARFLGNRNVKDIRYGELEDLLKHLRQTTDLSGKSLHDIFTTLHTFFKWVSRREKKFEMPDFPTIKYELKYRQTVDFETRAKILEEVRRLSWKENPKIYLGILWLSTYPIVRPIELLQVLERDIDLSNGTITITRSKVRGQYKRIYLIEEDVDTIRTLPRGMPLMPFFRHEKKKGQPAGKQFGKDYWYSWWRKACRNLSIKGVSLYPGTRHSTVTGLGDELSPEEIMAGASDHRTNKAFARYFHLKAERRRAISRHIRLKQTCTSSATANGAGEED